MWRKSEKICKAVKTGSHPNQVLHNGYFIWSVFSYTYFTMIFYFMTNKLSKKQRKQGLSIFYIFAFQDERQTKYHNLQVHWIKPPQSARYWITSEWLKSSLIRIILCLPLFSLSLRLLVCFFINSSVSGFRSSWLVSQKKSNKLMNFLVLSDCLRFLFIFHKNLARGQLRLIDV